MNKREIQNVANEMSKLNCKLSKRLNEENDGLISFVDDIYSIKEEWFKLIQDLLASIECGDSTIPAPHGWNQGGWKHSEKCWKHDDDARINEKMKFWEQHAITLAEEEEKAAKLENERRKQEIERNKYTS
jgi:hypothetical protein